jgi:hypothetical protein
MSLKDELDCVTPTWGDGWAPKKGPDRPLDDVALRPLPKELITKNGRAVIAKHDKDRPSNTTEREVLEHLRQAGGWVSRSVLTERVSCRLQQLVVTLSSLAARGTIERRRVGQTAEYRLVSE